jgi:hypothetical protein
MKLVRCGRPVSELAIQTDRACTTCGEPRLQRTIALMLCWPRALILEGGEHERPRDPSVPSLPLPRTSGRVAARSATAKDFCSCVTGDQSSSRELVAGLATLE